MASNKIKGITIQIGADTLGLDSALKGIEQKSKKVTDELKDVNKTIKITGDSATIWEQKQKLLNTALEDSKKKLQLLESAQEQVNKQFRDKNIGEEQYRAFQREVEYAKSAVNKYEKELEEAKNKVKELGSASDSAGQEISEFGDETSSAADVAAAAASGGLSAMAVALGTFVYEAAKKAAQEVVDFGKEVVQTGMTFESSMSSVAAISGATADELGVLEEKAKQMGATTKYTAAESADAFGYMALAGWKVEDMLNGIDGVLNLAAASNMDLARASDIVTDYLTAFGLTAKDSAHFVDIMTYAMANSNTTTERLGDAYKSCAATASSMGYSVEETTAVLMTMANAGIKGSEAGTALNAIMTRLATDTKNCATELAQYGVDVYDTEGNMQTLSSILEGVSEHWETLTDQEQANLAKMLAGTNHYAALQTIMNGLSDSAEEAGMSFNDYAKALEKCDGAASDMSTTMIDNLQGDITILDSAIDGMKLSLSDELNPALRDITQYITNQVPNAQKVLKPIVEGASKLIKGALETLPSVISVIKKYATPALEIFGGALKNAWNFATWLIEKLPGIGDFIAEVKQQKIFDNLTSESKALYDSVQADIDKMAELRKAAKEQTEIDLANTYKTEALYEELKNLVDENGKVKAGYEERVNYILHELSEATGTEIQLIDGVIQEYDKLQEKIEETIKKQRAQIFEKNYGEMYSEAILQNSTAASRIISAQNERKAAQAVIDEYNNRVKAIFAGKEQSTANPYLTRDFTYEEIGEASLENIGNWQNWGVFEREDITRLQAALESYTNASSAVQTLRANIPKNNRIIEQYEKAEEQLANGNYSYAMGLFASISNASVATFTGAKDDTDSLVKYFSDRIDAVSEELKTASDEDIKYGKDGAMAAIEQIADEMETEMLSASDVIKTGIIEKLSSIDGFDTTQLQEFMKRFGITIGDILKSSIASNLSVDNIADLIYGDNEALKNVYKFSIENFHIGKYATGGYIPLGNEAIVAEAGPELLQVMNGGIHVTPLSKTATNTSTESEGKTIIKNYYNSINATISSDYDVYDLAEKLAQEENYISQGKGE